MRSILVLGLALASPTLPQLKVAATTLQQAYAVDVPAANARYRGHDAEVRGIILEVIEASGAFCDDCEIVDGRILLGRSDLPACRCHVGFDPRKTSQLHVGDEVVVRGRIEGLFTERHISSDGVWLSNCEPQPPLPSPPVRRGKP